MFEGFMRKHLRKKGYSVRRRTRPGSPIRRTLAGTILGGIAGYYMDSNTTDAMSKALPELQQYLTKVYSLGMESPRAAFPNLHVEYSGYDQSAIDEVTRIVGAEGDLVAFDGGQLDFVVDPDKLSRVRHDLRASGYKVRTTRARKGIKRARRYVGTPVAEYEGPAVPDPRDPKGPKAKDMGRGIKAIRTEEGVAAWDRAGNGLMLRPEVLLELAILWNGPPLMREDEIFDKDPKPGCCGKCGDHAREAKPSKPASDEVSKPNSKAQSETPNKQVPNARY